MAVKTQAFGGTRVTLAAGVVGGVGLIIWSIGAVTEPRAALHGWLVAFAYVTSLALGGLLLLMMGYVTGARWIVSVRRLLESMAGPFAVLLLAFVPVVVGAEHLYAWVRPPEHVSHHYAHLLEHKAPYLNLPFFTVRGVFYFAVWAAVAFTLRRWSQAADDATAAAAPVHRRERALSAALLPVVGLTLTFAAFDWLMSLQPEWFGTMFGVYYFAGGFVGSLGLLTLMVFLTQRSGMAGDLITLHHFHALGRMLFGFSIFWAYIAYFQAMLTQIADRPEEVTFYLNRIEGGWQVVVAILIFGRFVVPFLVLLPRATKFRPRLMAVMGVWILAGQYLDTFWLVRPLLKHYGAVPNGWDIAALLGIGGLSVAFVAWRLRGRPLVPTGDPLLAASVAYRSPQ